MKRKESKNLKRKKIFRFKSFRVQLTLTFIGLMSLCILASIVCSQILTIRLYTSEQVSKIEAAFEEINDFAGSQRIVDGKYWLGMGISKRLDRMSVTENIRIVLLDPSVSSDRFVFSAGTSQVGLESIAKSIKRYSEDELKNDSGVTLEVSEDNYNIYRAKDDYLNSTNIDLIGVLDNGVYCFLRINYESIEKTAAMANNYFAAIGIVVIVLESFIIMMMLRRFIRPLENMNQVAKKMKELDFEARAEVTFDNEFGELAESLNVLSDTLEDTLLELKNANNELTNDIKKHIEIDEMRKDFLGNVSHELKTPIAIIQGYAEGLKDNINESPEDRAFYCDVIIDEAVKMNTMVKKLLSLNRMEYGKNQLEIERFDIVPLIKGLLDASEVLAGDRDIVVEFESEPSMYVYADEYSIEESLSNFISNAYHHVAGENIIRVKAVADGHVTRVSVYNSGSHIPPEDLDKVWIKFYKVDKARTREYGGSGIGLSIVKAVMDLHNQKCGVRNVDGGVEFFLELDNSPVEKDFPSERGNDDSNN